MDEALRVLRPASHVAARLESWLVWGKEALAVGGAEEEPEPCEVAQ